MSWARSLQTKISSIISEGILKHYGKKNMRSLSSQQALEVESVKFRVLSNIKKSSNVDENLVISIVSSGAEVPKRFKSCYDKVFSQHVKNVKLSLIHI